MDPIVYPSFPFCKCDTNPADSPLRLVFSSYQTIGLNSYACFGAIASGDVCGPEVYPRPACCDMDLGKLEFQVSKCGLVSAGGGRSVTCGGDD